MSLVGGVETRMAWSHTHRWWIKIGRDIWAVEIPSEGFNRYYFFKEVLGPQQNWQKAQSSHILSASATPAPTHTPPPLLLNIKAVTLGYNWWDYTTHHYHSESIVYSEAHLWCYTFYTFDEWHVSTIIALYRISLSKKILHARPSHHSVLPNFVYHWSFYCLHSFVCSRTSRSWHVS